MFEYCGNLIAVEISNVYHIGTMAFAGCTKLSEIRYNGTTEDWKHCIKDSNWKYSVGRIRVKCETGTLFE